MKIVSWAEENTRINNEKLLAGLFFSRIYNEYRKFTEKLLARLYFVEFSIKPLAR